MQSKTLTTMKLLENGSPVRTITALLKTNRNIRILQPAVFNRSLIAADSPARIHSRQGDVYTVWILEETTYHTLIVEVQQHVMGLYFEQYTHGIFPHLAGS